MTKQNTPKSTTVPTDMPAPQTLVVPEKFKTEDGQLNETSLLKSYLELEKKLGTSDNMKRPEKPEDYQIQIHSDLMKNDPDINRRLFDLGLTNEQAQGIYDLAAEKVVPVIESLSETFKMEKDLSELARAFGGEEQFNTVARQISAWGEKNLAPQIFNALSTSKDGILSMYQMMKNAQESSVLPRQNNTAIPETEASLKRLMQDPKYWKQQDPELLKRVEEGFKRLYG